MKACVLHAIGDLRYDEVPTPVPGPGEVLLRVGACGVCGSDLPRIFSKGAHRLPIIPGHEFAGQVVATGPQVGPNLMGRRAAVFPLIPCRKCPPCEIGAYAQCENYGYLGSRADGAFAEFICAPVWNLIDLPDALTFDEAAMTEPAAVALHALRRADAGPGDAVLIFGAGPVGLLAGLWARILGAGRVLLADIDAARLDFARTLGFETLVNPAQQDVRAWVTETTGRGADVVIEASGSAPAFQDCLQTARPFGRVVLMGNPNGPMGLSQEAYWAILRNELTVRGTWNSSFSPLPHNEWRLVLEYMADGRLDVTPLITHRVKLEGLWNALTMIRDRKAFSNKVMYVG